MSTMRRCMVPSLPIRVTMTLTSSSSRQPRARHHLRLARDQRRNLDAGTAAARDAAGFQPVIAPGDRTVPGSPPGSHAWPLP